MHQSMLSPRGGGVRATQGLLILMSCPRVGKLTGFLTPWVGLLIEKIPGEGTIDNNIPRGIWQLNMSGEYLWADFTAAGVFARFWYA